MVVSHQVCAGTLAMPSARAVSAEPSISPAPALSAGFLDSSSVRPDGGAVGLRHEASRNTGRMCSDSLAGQELARDVE